MQRGKEMIKAEQETSGGKMRVTLGGELSIKNARELRDLLMKALEQKEGIVLEFSECKVIDLSFIQLLCSAHRSASRAKRSLKLGDTVPELLLKTIGEAGCFRDKGCKFDSNNNCLWLRR